MQRDGSVDSRHAGMQTVAVKKGDDPEAEKSKSDLPKVNGIKGGESPLHELSPRGKDQPNGEGYPGNPEDTPLETGPRRGAEEKEEKKGGWGQRGSIEKQSSTGSKFPPKKPATPTKQSPRVYTSKRMSPNIGQPYSGQAPSAAAGWAGQYRFPVGAPRYSGPHYSGYQQPAYVPPRTMPPPSPSQGSSSGHSSGEQLSKTNLYIRGLTPNTTDQDLIGLCSPYGKIISTKAILDKNTNKCKGYGFVDFESPGAAQKAVSALQAQGVLAQMAKQQEQDPTNLYISNLPRNMTEHDLENMLAPHGTVVSTRVLRDNVTGISRGVGFARMDSTEQCEAIINKFNGKYLQGHTGHCEALLVKFADGGVKKKNPYQQQERRGWGTDDAVHLPYDPTLPNGLPPTPRVMHHPVIPASPYSPMSNTPSYSTVQTTWIQPHPHYVMQPHMGSASMMTTDSGMHMHAGMVPQLASQMNQLSISGQSYIPGTAGVHNPYVHHYPQPSGVMQTVPVEDQSQQQQGQQVGVADDHTQHYSFQQGK
ncbi:RNA-binding motif, single-stranded-interacting protein 1-like isoform X4 [Branchiostoma lanceolatum]|uniref:RNA-binding motif, single-stranded-interacting protein 1-like isoform X4 n=1 Tax=Branchiostoma lanceolatum TaxID=7740 RepID=UPI00345640BD